VTGDYASDDRSRQFILTPHLFFTVAGA